MYSAITSTPITPAASGFWTMPGVNIAVLSIDDNYSAADRSSLTHHEFQVRHGGAKLFAESASRMFSLAPISQDDATSAGGAAAPPAGGAGGGDDPKDPRRKVSAIAVFDALVSIRDRQSVFLDEPGLADVMKDYGIIEWVTNEGRAAMKKSYEKFKESDEVLKEVEKAIKDRKAEQAELGRAINSVTYSIGSLLFKSLREKLDAKRERSREIGNELAILFWDRKPIVAKVKRKAVLEVFLDRMARSDYHDAYATLTDKGAGLLRKMEGDRKLEYLTFDDYMRLIEG